MKPGPLDALENAVITGTIECGYTITTRDEKPAQLAIIDDTGKVVEAGVHVARECWSVVIQVHHNFLKGFGHLVSHSTPANLPGADIKALIWQGLSVTARDSKPALLAIIDDDSKVIEAGTPVARECWRIAIDVHINFLRGTGHIIFHSTPPGIPLRAKDSVATDPADKLQRPAGRGKK